MSFASLLVNFMFAKGDKQRDAGLTTPDDVIRYDNISYGTKRKWNLLDLYRPRNVEGLLPVIISVHGGGWVYGTKEVYQYYCMSLAQRGFAVVNFNYRLAPGGKYPAQLEDTNQVVKWVIENADKYKLDPDNIFMVGDSAGAHLLALYCSFCTNTEYAAKYSFSSPEGFVPKAVALNCGIYSVTEAFKFQNGLLEKLAKDLLGRNFSPQRLELIEPCLHINEKFPPSYVMTSTGDFLVDQPRFIVNVFEKLGIKHVSKIYGDESNLLPHVFHCNMRSEDAQICNDDECKFFLSI